MAAVLSDRQLAGLVQAAGWTGMRKRKGYREDAVAVAIILAESGGDADAHNDNPATRDDSYGLFQINMYGDLKKERAERYGLDSTANLYEPKKNVAVAYDLYRRAGNDFTDWTTYNNGRFLLSMPRALVAVENPDQDIPTIEDFFSRNLPDPVQQVAQVLEFVTDSDNWQRVALFVGGGVVIIVAVVMLAQESGVVGKAVNAVPVGRAASKLARKV